MDAKTRALTRDQIGAFMPDLRSTIAFENLQGDTSTTAQIFSGAPFITTVADSDLGSERVLTGSDNVTVADGGAGQPVVLDLPDKGTAGDFGDASHTLKITVDDKGAVTAILAIALNTDNIVEGVANLFFTVARVRAALSGSARVSLDAGTGVIDTIGFSGTVSPVNSVTFTNGICTAAS